MWLTTEADDQSSLHCVIMSTDVMSDHIGCRDASREGTGNHRRLISVNNIATATGDDVVRALLGFHAFTGSDCTSAFVGKGKKLCSS